jgi:hypothetical protein
MTVYAATVTIGRNIPPSKSTTGESVPMPPAPWTAFRASVRSLLLERGGILTVSSIGQGGWEGDPEENYVAVAIFEFDGADAGHPNGWFDGGGNTPSDVRVALAEELTGLKFIYKQDAIAFAWGPSELL